MKDSRMLQSKILATAWNGVKNAISSGVASLCDEELNCTYRSLQRVNFRDETPAERVQRVVDNVEEAEPLQQLNGQFRFAPSCCLDVYNQVTEWNSYLPQPVRGYEFEQSHTNLLFDTECIGDLLEQACDLFEIDEQTFGGIPIGSADDPPSVRLEKTSDFFNRKMHQCAERWLCHAKLRGELPQGWEASADAVPITNAAELRAWLTDWLYTVQNHRGDCVAEGQRELRNAWLANRSLKLGLTVNCELSDAFKIEQELANLIDDLEGTIEGSTHAENTQRKNGGSGAGKEMSQPEQRDFVRWLDDDLERMRPRATRSPADQSNKKHFEALQARTLANNAFCELFQQMRLQPLKELPPLVCDNAMQLAAEAGLAVGIAGVTFGEVISRWKVWKESQDTPEAEPPAGNTERKIIISAEEWQFGEKRYGNPGTDDHAFCDTYDAFKHREAERLLRVYEAIPPDTRVDKNTLSDNDIKLLVPALEFWCRTEEGVWHSRGCVEQPFYRAIAIKRIFGANLEADTFLSFLLEPFGFRQEPSLEPYDNNCRVVDGKKYDLADYRDDLPQTGGKPQATDRGAEQRKKTRRAGNEMKILAAMNALHYDSVGNFIQTEFPLQEIYDRVEVKKQTGQDVLKRIFEKIAGSPQERYQQALNNGALEQILGKYRQHKRHGVSLDSVAEIPSTGTEVRDD